VENKLQMVADAQVHALPVVDAELQTCALRLGYRDRGGVAARDALRREYEAHTVAVHAIFESAFHGDRLT
jgi:glutamate-ammonia-ligase adenylyltransferase